jgi:peptide/nickel transport system substrate-binding protein
MLRDAGYGGERVLVMSAADNPVTSAMTEVAADVFRKLGMNVDVLAMDLGTLVQRRANKAAPDKGGWNAFTTTYEGLTMADPATNVGLRGNGPDAWFGWPTSPDLERSRESWFDAPDDAARRAAAENMQVTAFTDVPFIPLGQLFYPTAIRAGFDGLIPSPFPIFWNLRKA